MYHERAVQAERDWQVLDPLAVFGRDRGGGVPV